MKHLSVWVNRIEPDKAEEIIRVVREIVGDDNNMGMVIADVPQEEATDE